MRVLQHNAVRLSIQERLIGIWLLSWVTVGTGIFMFFLFESPVDWIGAMCIALGGIFATLTPTETLTFDKALDYVTFHQQRWSGSRMIRYRLKEVTSVEVYTQEVWGTRFYQVTLLMASGQAIALSRTLTTDWQQQQKIVRHIRGFLNKPLRPTAVEQASSTQPQG